MTKNTTTQGHVSWKSPSNIAIVKYWGKHGRQLPRNASLSLTLSNAHTITNISYEKREKGEISVSFLFEGEANASFQSKIERYLGSISDEMPWLLEYHLDISSSNSFPHSSGIASSASAMSALALCLVEIESVIQESMEDRLGRVSHFSRLGSGSASRSVIPRVGLWGKHPSVPTSSDEYAVVIDDVDSVFYGFHDDILIISPEEKSVSSTAGHALMEGNIFAQARYQQANARIVELLAAMKAGDVETFGKIAEDEAMTLHALMMCSDPSYVLMKPGTLAAIEKIRNYRKDTGHPVYFTLDAGPNIHLLYPDHIAVDIESWIQDDLRSLCHEGRIIKDHVGEGPIKC